MSLPATRFRCTGCTFTGSIFYTPTELIYHLPSGETATGDISHGWCCECNASRDIEQLRDPFVIDVEIIELEISARRSLFERIFGLDKKKAEEKLAQIKNLKLALSLAKDRKSPPRCLTCGSNRTLPLVFSESGLSTSFFHHCGERLQLLPQNSGATRYSLRRTQIDLDPEGNRLNATDA